MRRGSGPICVMWPLCAAALPTCPSPSSCLGSAGANGTLSPKHSQLPPLRSQSPWASRTSRLGSVSVPPLSTVARVPDGQAWTQHRQPRRAGVKPEQLVSERGTGSKGGQAGAGGSGGVLEPHQASRSSFKRADIQAEAQSPSQDHQRVAGGAGRGGAAGPRVTVKSCPPLPATSHGGPCASCKGR